MEQKELDELKVKIMKEFMKSSGDFALVFKELGQSNRALYINENQTYHAASTMKTPVMIEVFKQASQGKFKLEDLITVKNEFKSIVDGSPFALNISDDGGEELYSFIGKRKSIYDLVYNMITVSSNLATNQLNELVGAKNVTKTLKEIGADDIKILRGVEDLKAYNKGMNNTTTAIDLAIIFEKIAERKIISANACDSMISILSDQKFKDKIPAMLPSGVMVAH